MHFQTIATVFLGALASGALAAPTLNTRAEQAEQAEQAKQGEQGKQLFGDNDGFGGGNGFGNQLNALGPQGLGGFGGGNGFNNPSLFGLNNNNGFGGGQNFQLPQWIQQLIQQQNGGQMPQWLLPLLFGQQAQGNFNPFGQAFPGLLPQGISPQLFNGGNGFGNNGFNTPQLFGGGPGGNNFGPLGGVNGFNANRQQSQGGWNRDNGQLNSINQPGGGFGGGLGGPGFGGGF